MTASRVSASPKTLPTLSLRQTRSHVCKTTHSSNEGEALSSPPQREGTGLDAVNAGGLDSEARRLIARKGSSKAEGLNLGIGARLTRQWQGRLHEVIVEADHFRWEGKRYKSLSAVASAIAGTRWNGPRFFGLRGSS